MRLGEMGYTTARFQRLEEAIKPLTEKEFLKKPDRIRSNKVNEVLFHLIEEEEEPCFLLGALLEYVEEIEKRGVLSHYTLNSFEIWLNQHSGLSSEKNFEVRAKIVGKKVPREEYQDLFPIGMGRIYEGSHIVTAHKSPDLDTTIASFWGWVDAFGARVGKGLHLWNLPGGPPGSQIEIDLIFRDIFGKAIFTHLPKTKSSLSLTANDLFTVQGMEKKEGKDSSFSEKMEGSKKATVLIDHEGYFKGDWKEKDAEAMSRLLMLFHSCIRWFENQMNLALVQLFAKKDLHISQLSLFIDEIFQKTIKESDPLHEISSESEALLSRFLEQILDLPRGVQSTYRDLADRVRGRLFPKEPSVQEVIASIKHAAIFDKGGHVMEDRPKIFHFLEMIFKGLHATVQALRAYLQRMDVAIEIKKKVFGHPMEFVTVRAEVEEMRSKMGGASFLAVAYPDDSKFYPVGVIYDQDLRKSSLGTVSLRDFCNRDEIGLPSYLEVISVVDHHKTDLNTFTPPCAYIADVQSSNTLVAELAFQLNDRYSTLGISDKELHAELKKEKDSTLLQHLQKRLDANARAKREKAFISPEREKIEYLHFLNGILDDTDLLAKVSRRDVEVVAELLNRLHSLQHQKESRIISFDDLPATSDFAKVAAKRLLQNVELYSIYRRTFHFREEETERNILLEAKGESSNFFSDTKEQNRLARVGQTKIFAKNFPAFSKSRDAIIKRFLEKAKSVHANSPEIDFHLHMISTIIGADEVYQGKSLSDHSHQDEIWIWTPPTESGYEHLKRFLSGFRELANWGKRAPHLEIREGLSEYEAIFRESFIPKIPIDSEKSFPPIACIKIKPGTLNSRKAEISPFLPK